MILLVITIVVLCNYASLCRSALAPELPVDLRWVTLDWRECNATCGGGVQARDVFCAEHFNDSQGAPQIRKMDDSYCIWQEPKPEVRLNCNTGQCPAWEVGDCWLPGQWDDCSTTCGPGVQRRRLECVIIMPITQNQMVWPAYECDGKTKPEEFMPCEIRQCPHSLQSHEASQGNSQPFGLINEDSHVYRWDYGQWGPCSASCLGGVQRATLKCVNKTGQQVDMSNCNPNQRLADYPQPCNTGKPCPQRWVTFPFTQCTHTCGGGSQKRDVRCQQEIGKSKASATTVILDDLNCSVDPETGQPVPKPTDRQACNMKDCPVYWELGNFSRCSTTCGFGQQTRTVLCKQVIANGTLITRDPKLCSHLKREHNMEECKFEPCPKMQSPTFNQKANMRLMKQQKPHDGLLQASENNKNGVTLKVPASLARLLEGRNVKIKCPVKDFDRSQLKWLKDGQPIESPDYLREDAYKHKVIITKNGALRIFSPTSSDNGVYTCIGDKVYGNITLFFKPDDGYNNKQGKFKGKPPQTDKTNKLTNYDRTNDLVVDPQPDWPDSSSREKSGNGDSSVYIPNRLSAGASDQRDKFQSNVSLSKSGSQSLLEELAAELSSKDLIDMYAALRRANSIKAVKFQWVESAWPLCSQTCTKPGMAGSLKFRSVQCRADIEQYSANVSDNICEKAGYVKPHESEVCGFTPCPNERQPTAVRLGAKSNVKADWEMTHFSSCETSTCKKWMTGVITRQIYCKYPNGTRVSDRYCKRRGNAKPKSDGECFNPTCIGVWITSDWSHCTRTCGRYGEGVQLRALTCVWQGTHIPAGMACSGAARPNATQPCDGLSPCPKTNDITGLFKDVDSDCQDSSKYCPMVKYMGKCNADDYSKQCCITCNYLPADAKK